MRKPVAAKVIALMAKGHSYLWRKPGRRDEERRRFAALMRRVEKIRVRLGMNKTELAAELETTTDALKAWMTGRTVGRKETVAKIRDFLKREA
jgi:DNA-binding transcriptional regulator YiaG